MYRFLFPSDVFSELHRLQQVFESNPSIRGFGHSTFPVMNIGNTPQSVELFAFIPGLDPAALDIKVERGVLTITGERKPSVPTQDEKTSVHINERFSGYFRRVINLPEDADPDAVNASYEDGVLRISVNRLKSAQPRRISINQQGSNGQQANTQQTPNIEQGGNHEAK